MVWPAPPSPSVISLHAAAAPQPLPAARNALLPGSLRSVETFDVDDQAASLEGWSQRYQQLSAGAFRGRTLQARLAPGLHFLSESTNRQMLEHSMPPAGTHTFALLDSATGPVRINDQLVDEHSLLATPGGLELSLRVPEQAVLTGLQVDDADLQDLQAVYADGLPQGALRAPASSRTSAPLARRSLMTPRLRHFCREVRRVCEQTPQMLEHPATQRALKSAALSQLMQALSAEHLQPWQAPASEKRRRLLAQEARSYIDAHLDEVTTVADVCKALGVSRRLLQYCFEDILQINPIAYIRAMRLNAVRRDLKLADPRLATVADVASRWGFWHLGHFSADYKKMFGELPSTTLAAGGLLERAR